MKTEKKNGMQKINMEKTELGKNNLGKQINKTDS